MTNLEAKHQSLQAELRNLIRRWVEEKEIDSHEQFAALDAESAFATDSRTSTALRQDTRAPASKMMADTEVLPAGQKWRLLLEVWHPKGEGALGSKAAAILADWATERANFIQVCPKEMLVHLPVPLSDEARAVPAE